MKVDIQKIFKTCEYFREIGYIPTDVDILDLRKKGYKFLYTTLFRRYGNGNVGTGRNSVGIILNLPLKETFFGKRVVGYYTINNIKNDLILYENKLKRIPLGHELDGGLKQAIKKQYKNFNVNNFSDFYFKLFNKRPSQIISMCNHRVNSINDLIICNILYFNEIEHLYNERINNETNYRFDHKLLDLNNNDFYIENTSYDFDRDDDVNGAYFRKFINKEKLYKDDNKNFLLFGRDFFIKETNELIYRSIVGILIGKNIIHQNNVKYNENYDFIRYGENKFFLEEIKNYIDTTIELNGKYPSYNFMSKNKKFRFIAMTKKLGGTKKVSKMLNIDNSFIDNSWSKEDEDILIKNYSIYSANYISKLLSVPRKVYSIMKKAFRLKLGGARGTNQYSKKIK